MELLEWITEHSFLTVAALFLLFVFLIFVNDFCYCLSDQSSRYVNHFFKLNFIIDYSFYFLPENLEESNRLMVHTLLEMLVNQEFDSVTK